MRRFWCDGADANVEHLRKEMAWVYDRYNTDNALYAVQRDVQAARRGLCDQHHERARRPDSGRQAAFSQIQPDQHFANSKHSSAVTAGPVQTSRHEMLARGIIF